MAQQKILEGVSEVADDASRTARALFAQVADDRKTLLSTPGATVTAIQLFERLPEHPVIMSDRKRDRLYCYANYLRILD
ncbi:MAG: hypothetical protein O3A63_11015 [Proteobacteria bacterium]|nr:hypothetical protein [Pseudomonadota bacterium]